MIIIDKAARRLRLVRQGETLLSCPVSLGREPVGHKEREGDGRTPEGKYRVCSVNRQSKFYISLGISYPARRDALRGLRLRRIGLIDCALLVLADLMHLRPKWTTALGGFIMLHGPSPDGLSGDWTQGCIALSKEDTEKLASLCKRGETVLINP